MRTNLILALIVLLGFGLRVANMGEYGYFFDENLTLSNAQGIAFSDVNKAPVFTTQSVWANPIGLQRACVEDDSGNGILHTYFVSAWTALVGYSEGWARLHSVFWSLVAIFGTFLLARRLLPEQPAIALLAAAFMAGHPFFIEYSRILRAYPQAVALSLLATVVLVRQLQAYAAQRLEKVYLYWILYGLLFAGVFGSHYLACMVFVLHGLLVFLTFKLRVYADAAAGVLLGAGLAAIWYFNGGQEGMGYMALRNEGHLNLALRDGYKAATPAYLSSGSFELYAAFFGDFFKDLKLQFRYLIPLGLPFLGLLAPVLTHLLPKSNPDANKWRFLCLAPIFAFTFAFALALKAGHIVSFSTHYSLWYLPYFAILLGASLHLVYTNAWYTGIWKNAYTVLLILWIGLLVRSYGIVVTDAHYQRPANPYPAMQADLLKIATLEDTIVYDHPRDAVVFNLFFPRENQIPQKIVRKLSQDSSNYIRLINKMGQEVRKYPTHSQKKFWY